MAHVHAVDRGNSTAPVQATDSLAKRSSPPGASTACRPAGSRLATITYTHDKLYRLTGATDVSGATSYSYDRLGNRLSPHRVGVRHHRGNVPVAKEMDARTAACFSRPRWQLRSARVEVGVPTFFEGKLPLSSVSRSKVGWSRTMR